MERRPILRLAIGTVLAGAASALLVAPNSPCSTYCGNVLSTTTGDDMTCSDSAYSTSTAGKVFETCIDCELSSTYSSDNQTDLQWLLYNLRYALSYCLFGQPNYTETVDSPCLTSTACLPLDDSFYWNNLSTADSAYAFCDGWLDTQVVKCTSCLRSGSMDYSSNFVTVLDAACSQMPSAGSTLSVDGTPFSTVPMNVTTPSQTSEYTYTPSASAISLGGKVGIAVGGFAFLLAVAGCSIVCLGRRRRRAYLRSLETKYGHTTWPSPPVGYAAHESTDTPMSQRPLRGWDDNSPMSATSEGRYFSPYSSQYNSPVNAVDGKPQAWPSVASMASMSDGYYGGHEADPGIGSSSSRVHLSPTLAGPAQGALIGVALGGPDPSLRSKNSNKSMGAVQDSKAPEFGLHTGSEAYELREIDSDGIPVAGPASQVPALRHPGYGRNSPSTPPFGTLTETDAKKGYAM